MSWQTELRVVDDISQVDKLILKPDEQDLWQEAFWTLQAGTVPILQQVRLEQRFIPDIEGMIPRFRYLIHAKFQLKGKKYLVGQEAIRFNLADKGTGPVSGFEQSRLYLAIGFEVSHTTRIEAGYLWHHQLEREQPNPPPFDSRAPAIWMYGKSVRTLIVSKLNILPTRRRSSCRGRS